MSKGEALARPSNALLGRRCGLSDRTVRDALHGLVDLGFLRVARAGRGTVATYQATLPTPEESSDPPRKDLPTTAEADDRTPEAASDEPNQNQESELPDQGTVSALVDQSLASGEAPDPISCLLAALPQRSVKTNTRAVLEATFSPLPLHMHELALEELRAARNVRNPAAYLVRIGQRYARERAA
jgi:hypothetical protein